MLFEKAYEEYKIYAAKRHKKQSFDCLLYNFNSNIYSFFKEYVLEDINLNSILKWQDFIISKDFSNNHNKNLFAMLKDFLYFCSISYNYDFTIFSFVSKFPLKIEKKKVDFYTYSEFKRFINCVDNVVYKTFFNFMYFVGTRPGEAMALKFSDLNGNYITINKTIDSHSDRSVGTPKTFSSNRTIEIDNKLKLELLTLKDFYIDKYCDSNFDYYIFGGVKPLAPTTINRYKIKACDKAGIRAITLHQFRHSHATLLFNKGINIHVIKDRLGHSKASTTIDIYTHNSLKQEKRVLNTLNFLRLNIFECLLYNFKNLIFILKHW